jgi:predicted nucleotidyltransferase component of viral defense system
MHDNYYQNILYPLQDKVLNIVGRLPVDFYLTGGTALSRAYLFHRYSDDLDFFVNGVSDFKKQVKTVINAITDAGLPVDTSVADDGFARIFVFVGEFSLKIDFVNDVPFRYGSPNTTPLFVRTDNVHNILSNKVTALGRYSARDVVDIVYICEYLKFNWEVIMNDASEKDLWVNPVHVVEVLDQFPVEKLQEINWVIESPSHEWFVSRINRIIPDILDGSANSLKRG